MFGRSVKIAAAALVAAGALAGCGDAPKPGTAAIVGDDRITVTSLSQTVRDWRTQFKNDALANRIRAGAAGQGDQLGTEAGESDLRMALTLLVNFQVVERLAKEQGVAVPDGRTDDVLREMNQQPGGATSITLASGLPGDRSRDLARFVATKRLLLERLGSDGNPQSPATMQAGQRYTQLIRGTAGRLHIEVNPRYGTFDPLRGNVGQVAYRLSSPESGLDRS